MIIIKDILISDDLVEQQFLCDLNACKGACCWEGDWGAPLEAEELTTLENIYGKIKPFLSIEGQQAIDEHGLYRYYDEPGYFGTPLLDNGACVYMTFGANGIAQCGIENAYNAGIIDFKKPISCHLFPVRVHSEKGLQFEALNYSRWDICNAACKKGAENQMPVYRFVKEALIRKYGVDFFEELDEAAKFMASDRKNKA